MSFAKIYEKAVARKGESALKTTLPEVASPSALVSRNDREYLAEMSKCIFRSGFVWQIVDNKWPAFESAFADFNPLAVAHFSDEKLESLGRDASIIRNHIKIQSVRDNAAFVVGTAREHGGFGEFLAGWPHDDVVGLLLHLKKFGSRLGGHTGQYFLRFSGVDTFIFSKDVVAVLVAEGIVDKEPTSKRDLAKVQEAFNEWRSETGLPYSHISRIMANAMDAD